MTNRSRAARALVWPAAGILVFTVAARAAAQTKAPDPVSQARQFYNDQRYDDAIRIAGQMRHSPALADAASVVFARAHLERFRMTADRADLAAAREALKTIDATRLSPRDEVELEIGLGESLYLDDDYAFDDRYSAAAEEFELALGHADLLDEASRDLLFDWWAQSLDRQAQQGPETDRHPIYQRIVDRAALELARSSASLSATYWLAAGARGIDDLPRALGAAVAGWVRAGTFGARGEALRDDLDRLIVQVILPERAQQLAFGADPHPALDLLQKQWADVKEKWGKADGK
mgnify:CR=1 FL=1|jgi:hypothetical protein